MQVQAITKNINMSAQKMREVTRQIQGLPALRALAILRVVPRKSARVVAKTLHSAIANAENNNALSADDLYVQEARVDEGPTLKRWQFRAMGRVNRIRKRSSHITIAVEQREVRS